MDLLVMLEPTACITSLAGSPIDPAQVLIVASPSHLLQAAVTVPMQAVAGRFESAYNAWRDLSRHANWAPRLAAEGMSNFLAHPAIHKALNMGALHFPLTEPSEETMQAGLTVHHFLSFLVACNGTTIPAEGITPLDGIALINVVLFFFSTCFEEPSWIQMTVLFRSLSEILAVIEQPQYSDRFRLSQGIDPAVWLQRLIQCVQEVLRQLEKWGHPPSIRIEAAVGGVRRTIADPKSLLPEQTANLQYYKKILDGQELGTSTFARGTSRHRPSHLFAATSDSSGNPSAITAEFPDRESADAEQGKKLRKHARTPLFRLTDDSASLDTDAMRTLLADIPKIKDKNLCLHFCCSASKGCQPKKTMRYCKMLHIDVSNLGRFSHDELKPIRDWMAKHRALITATDAAKSSVIFKPKS